VPPILITSAKAGDTFIRNPATVRKTRTILTKSESGFSISQSFLRGKEYVRECYCFNSLILRS
jgi:hypothetical protein